MSSKLKQLTLSAGLVLCLTNYTSSTFAAVPIADQYASVDLKILLVSATGTDPELDAIRRTLETMGTPFDVMVAKDVPLDDAYLVDASNGVGKYSGIILTSGNLGYDTGNGWVSAFDGAEWNRLWGYELNYGVRQVTLNAFPSNYPENYGFDFDSTNAVNGDTYPVDITDAGRDVFNYVTDAAQIPLRYSWVYRAKLSANSTATPLITDPAGGILALRSDSTDGRERIVTTYSLNQHMIHTQMITYGLIRWVSQDKFIGARQVFLHADVDDWFQHSDQWNPAIGGIDENVFRIDEKDVWNTYLLQNKLGRTYPLIKGFKLAIAFNGQQANPKAPRRCFIYWGSVDPLTSASKCMRRSFDWINHTFTEQDMDFTDYATSLTEIKKNFKLGKTLRLKMSKKALVTGTHSGLGYYPEIQPDGSSIFVDHGLNASNPNLLKALKDSKVRYLAANISVPSQIPPCSSCGITHPMEPEIFLIPRYPTNVFYYSTTPEEETSAYNTIYGPNGTAPFWDHDFNYSEILDFETDIALLHMIRYEPFPHFFHQANLRKYQPGKNLVFDWTEALMEKYSKLFKLPVVNKSWNNLGKHIERQTRFYFADRQGTWNRITKQITLTSSTGGPMIFTGIKFGSSSVYGTERLSSTELAPNQTLTLSAP